METVFTPNIECIETRLTEHGDVYCRYKIGPIYSKQALTLIQGIRTGMLNEIRGFAFVGVEILGVQNEFQFLKGVKESTVEVLLNLTKIVLTGNFFTKLPLLAYLSGNGPGEVKANSLRLPPHIRCLNPDQLIATLSEKGALEMKLLIKCTGGTNPNNGFGLTVNKNQTFPDISSSHLTNLDPLKGPPSNKKLQKELRIKPLYNTHNKNLQKEYLPLYQQIVQKDSSGRGKDLTQVVSRDFQKNSNTITNSSEKDFSFYLQNEWNNEKKEIKSLEANDANRIGKKNLNKKPKNFSQVYLTRFPPRWEKTHLLSLEAQFSPVQAVIVGWQEEIKMGQEVVFLQCQICTNGSIHPLAALNVGIANFLQTVSSMLWVNWVTMPRVFNPLSLTQKNKVSLNNDLLTLQKSKFKKNFLYRYSGKGRDHLSSHSSDKRLKAKLNQRSQFIANKLVNAKNFLMVSGLGSERVERQKLFFELFSYAKKTKTLKYRFVNRKLSKESLPLYPFSGHLSMNRWRCFAPPRKNIDKLTGNSSTLRKTKLVALKEISQWQKSFQELSWKNSRKHQDLRFLENGNQIRYQHLFFKKNLLSPMQRQGPMRDSSNNTTQESLGNKEQVNLFPKNTNLFIPAKQSKFGLVAKKRKINTINIERWIILAKTFFVS